MGRGNRLRGGTALEYFMVEGITSVLSEKYVTKALDFPNEIGARRPNEWLWIAITLIRVGERGLLQRAHRRVASTPDALFGHFSKQSFYQVQPTATGWGEVNVVSRMSSQPSSHSGDLCALVVLHQVDLKTGGQIRIDVVEEPQELLVADAADSSC